MGEQFGRYRLDETLGQGGMGIVYRAWDSVLERVVALKMVLASGDLDRDVRERFLREARSAAQLTHRNIVTIYDLGEHDGRLYLAMEFLEGEDLQKRVGRAEKASFERKLAIAIEICQGVEFAHAHGVIHRDLKPGNIFITNGGAVKILDFGLARFVSSQLTQSNMLMGTINYMSPEQVRGERADQQSDVFSLGLVLYELFGGRRAFQGDSAASTMYKILQEFPEPLWKIDPQLPREFADVVDRALAKRREERYPDAASLRRDLELVQNLAHRSGPPSPWPSSADVTLPATPAAGVPPPVSGPSGVPRPGSAGRPAVSGSAASQKPASGSLAVSDAAAGSVPGSGAAAAPGSGSPSYVPTPAGPVGRGFWTGAGVGALAITFVIVWMANRRAEPTVPASLPSSPATQAQAVPQPTTTTAPAPTIARQEPPVISNPSPEPAAPTRTTPEPPASARRDAQKRTSPERTTTVPARPPAVESTAARNSEKQAAPPPAPQPTTTVPAPQPGPAQPVPVSPPAQPPPTIPAIVRPSAPAEAPALTAERANDLLQRYKASLEAKSLDQLKRIWPSLGGAAEEAMRQEFQHASRITVDVSDSKVSATGSSGHITFVRHYNLATVDGQRLRSTSDAVMDVRWSGDAWVIDAIRFTPR